MPATFLHYWKMWLKLSHSRLSGHVLLCKSMWGPAWGFTHAVRTFCKVRTLYPVLTCWCLVFFLQFLVIITVWHVVAMFYMYHLNFLFSWGQQKKDVNLLADSCLFRYKAVREQHYHSSGLCLWPNDKSIATVFFHCIGHTWEGNIQHFSLPWMLIYVNQLEC